MHIKRDLDTLLRPFFKISFKFKKFFLIYFWLHWAFIAAHRLSLLEVSGGDSLVVVPRLLIVVASFVAEHGHQGVGALVVS